MKKLVFVVLVLALLISAVPGMAESAKEFTYVVPRTVEVLEDSPFHIAKMLLAEQGITMNIMDYQTLNTQ